jgi:xylan 1,4-beta-xylosidase
LWRSVQSDEFESNVLSPNWHFMTKNAAASYSLTARKGWIRLTPETERTHLLQKETDHYYTALTRVDLDANDSTAKAGIYLTNGNQRVIARLYTGYNDGKKIIFTLGKETRSISNQWGNSIWLKLERKEHSLTGFCSSDGIKWNSLGDPISAINIDKVQPNYNSWVGTSVGLFAEGKPADFDFFICKDGFTSMPVAGYNNYFGIRAIKKETEKLVTNTSSNGGWLMISGVEFGKQSPSAVELTASSVMKGKIEIWLDDLKNGKLIATIQVSPTDGENNLKVFSRTVKNITGHHDVFIKFPIGVESSIFIKSLRFVK